MKQLDAALPEILTDERRACKDVDPDIFYPYNYRDDIVEPARKLCRSCPVMQQCGEWAIKSGEPEGVWGTLTPKERRKIRKDLNLC